MKGCQRSFQLAHWDMPIFRTKIQHVVFDQVMLGYHKKVVFQILWAKLRTDVEVVYVETYVS